MKIVENRILKILLTVMGSVFVAIGVIGIFVPLLPTTVFFILAAACYVRSSERLYNWLLNNKMFGPYIKNYLEHRAMPMRAKVLAISMIWLSIGYSAIFAVKILYVKVILFLIAILVSAYLVSIKTLKKEN